MPQISVVVPVYGCAGCLRALHERLVTVLEGMGQSFEIVLVDDCGPDGSWPVIEDLVRMDERVRGFRLSRNFGQHAAITAGLAASRGSWVVVMDCDLQDPPEEIPRLYAKALDGYEVVLARRAERSASAARRLGARAYFKAMNTFTGAQIDGSYGTFSLISRKVADAYLGFRDRDRHYLFILYWLGFSQASIDFEHGERHDGESSYRFRTLVRHALDGVFFQTTVVLRWIVFAGFMMAAAGALLAAYFVMSRALGTAAPGWTSLAVFTLSIGGFIILSTGVTGLYIGKVFDQVKERPLYVIDREAAPVEARDSQESVTR